MHKDLTVLKAIIDADYKRHMRKFEKLEKGKPIVFLGDSMIAYFPLSRLGLTNKVYNQGIPGDTTTGVLNRLEHVIRLEPKQVLIQIGLNDYMFTEHNSTDIYNQILKIHHILKSSIKDVDILIVNMTPINISHFKDQIFVKYRNLDDTDPLNELLKQDKDLKIIDLNKPIIDENHELNIELTKDGIHLNEKGYEIYYKLLEKRLVQ